jgi:hypothetical protein
VVEKGILVQKPGRQQVVAEVAMQLLSTASLAAEDIETAAAVARAAVVV